MARKTSDGKERSVQVNISTGMIVKILAILGFVAALYFFADIVAILLLSLLLAALIDPFARFLERHKVPRVLAVIIVYLVLLALFIGAFFLVVPTTVDQTKNLLQTYAPVIEQASGGQLVVQEFLSGDFFKQDFDVILNTVRESGLVDAFPELFTVIADIFGGIITFVVVLILAFYMVIDEKSLRRGMDKLILKKYRTFLTRLMPELRKHVGSWLRGQLLLMFLIFLMTFAALLIMQVPYALVLALIAGLLEIIPFLGPFLAAVPAIVIAFSVSPVHAIIVAAIYFVIQQIEGEILTPKVMEKAAGLNPVVSILSILLGFEAARLLGVSGIVGAFLAIPFAMVVGVILNEWAKYKETL